MNNTRYMRYKSCQGYRVSRAEIHERLSSNRQSRLKRLQVWNRPLNWSNYDSLASEGEVPYAKSYIIDPRFINPSNRAWMF